MTLTQMQYYIAVCRHMSLTKAARELHVSQPALSMAIKEVENECGAALFHHTANSLAITDYGLVLLDEVKPIVDQYQHLQQLLSDNLLNRKYVRITLSTLNGNTVFPEIAGRLRKNHPDIRLFITETGDRQHYENLDNNKADLSITTTSPEFYQHEWKDSSIYAHIALKQSDMVFAVSVDNPLSGKTEAGWDEIVQEPLILLEKSSSSLTDAFLNELYTKGYALPENIYYTSQSHTVVRFIEENAAAGFLPAQTAAKNPRITGLNCPVSSNRWIYLVYRKDHHLSRSAKLFIQTAQEVFAVKTGKVF